MRLWVAMGLLVVGAAAAAGALWWMARAPEDLLEGAVLPAEVERLVPLHTRLGKPLPGDWLTEHVEMGRTCERYVSMRRHLRADGRKVVCVQPLGEFRPAQRKILDVTAEFMSAYYQMPVRVGEDLPLSLIPEEETRRVGDERQLRTGYILKEILAPRLPDDAAAMLAFTTEDLWPGEGWNFVYGEAMPSKRVGVWSICRFGRPEESDEAFAEVLRRVLRTGVHETGHLFGFQHCIFYECCMCGSNHLGELDRRPLWVCPQCLGKLCFVTGADPRKRFGELAAFARAHGLADGQAFWEKSLAALGDR